MGEIQSIGPQYGFIRDFKTSAKLWFACSELIDSTNTAYSRGEYVVYTRSKNYAGDTAICIHKPMQIKELLTLVDNLVKAGKKNVVPQKVVFKKKFKNDGNIKYSSISSHDFYKKKGYFSATPRNVKTKVAKNLDGQNNSKGKNQNCHIF